MLSLTKTSIHCSAQACPSLQPHAEQLPAFPLLLHLNLHTNLHQEVPIVYVTILHLTFGLYFKKFTLLSRFKSVAGFSLGCRWSFQKYLAAIFQSAGAALGFSRTQVPFRLWLLWNASAFSQALGIRGPRSSENSNRCLAAEITAFLNLGTTNYSHPSIYALLHLALQSLSETDGQLRFPKVTQILRSPTHTGSQYQLIFQMSNGTFENSTFHYQQGPETLCFLNVCFVPSNTPGSTCLSFRVQRTSEHLGNAVCAGKSASPAALRLFSSKGHL